MIIDLPFHISLAYYETTIYSLANLCIWSQDCLNHAPPPLTLTDAGESCYTRFLYISVDITVTKNSHIHTYTHAPCTYL